MSDETLRRAAALMRERADWLDFWANWPGWQLGHTPSPQHGASQALAVARTYLGESA